MTNIVMLIGPGRYRLTQQALESLQSGTDPDSYSLTLVCDGVDFRTRSLVDRQAENEPVTSTVLHVENSGHTLSQLKNLGVAWSEQRFGRWEWLYFSDNDVFFTLGWMGKLTDVAGKSESLGFRLWGGQIHPFHQKKYQDPEIPECAHRITEHVILDGPSWLMRWNTWDEYGPFQRTTAPGPCQSEEYPFCERLTLPIHPSVAQRTEYEKYVDGNRNLEIIGGGRIGVISPHVVVHTGLTHLNGQDAPGRKERELMIPEGVLAL